MVKSWLDGDIVWVEINGEFIADEIVAETTKWLVKPEAYIGYMTDIRQMTKQTVYEQKKAEDQAKKNKSGKPRAVLGKDSATAALVNIYIRFTRAEGIRYFTQVDEAKAWLKTYQAA
jgi:hypothetical protein